MAQISIWVRAGAVRDSLAWDPWRHRWVRLVPNPARPGSGEPGGALPRPALARSFPQLDSMGAVGNLSGQGARGRPADRRRGRASTPRRPRRGREAQRSVGRERNLSRVGRGSVPMYERRTSTLVTNPTNRTPSTTGTIRRPHRPSPASPPRSARVGLRRTGTGRGVCARSVLRAGRDRRPPACEVPPAGLSRTRSPRRTTPMYSPLRPITGTIVQAVRSRWSHAADNSESGKMGDGSRQAIDPTVPGSPPTRSSGVAGPEPGESGPGDPSGRNVPRGFGNLAGADAPPLPDPRSRCLAPDPWNPGVRGGVGTRRTVGPSIDVPGSHGRGGYFVGASRRVDARPRIGLPSTRTDGLPLPRRGSLS